MKLYTMPGACSLADHIVLHWSQLPFEVQVISHENTKSPEYLKLNPAGSVPVLIDGDWALTQNSAILHYIAEIAPGAQLNGDGTPQGRAEVNRWLGLINADLHPAYRPLFGGTRYLQDPDVIAKTQDSARTKLREYYERIDTQLRGRDWLTGKRSIADAYLFVTLLWARALNVDLGGLDNLERFSQSMLADPGVIAAMKTEGL
ncbi:MAG: glutathione S-transferase N-terminal domain-containing protein [Xanthomonadaceae bacterium]|jgi:glutathione S-transferase|nr:glutathione S-transferase N-terminal domain-containing protein [Xanthomonadaceae bacterium]